MNPVWPREGCDIVREDKGHTEGLEPHISETLVKLMLSAKPATHSKPTD